MFIVGVKSEVVLEATTCKRDCSTFRVGKYLLSSAYNRELHYLEILVSQLWEVGGLSFSWIQRGETALNASRSQ